MRLHDLAPVPIKGAGSRFQSGQGVIAAQALIIAVFVSIHLFAGKLHFLHVVPRSRWLSLAGGTSVAYVFIHVFPELQEAQESIDNDRDLLRYLEHHAYLLALAGLAVFYGLERVVKKHQADRGQQPGDHDEHLAESSTSNGVFWIHIGSFAVYNLLIGYLLVHRDDQDTLSLVFFGIAMGLHFLVNDFGLRQDHRKAYHHRARWVLAAAIVVGWILGLVTEISAAATGALFAFIAGGVILNVLKEELPEERKSRFLPFALGLAGYAALLLLA